MPGTVKRIVCLANSFKPGGRCIAGKEHVGGTASPWIRPVSSRPKDSVNALERQYVNGAEPALLHVLDVPLLKATPSTYQSENWLLDPSVRWKKVGTLGWKDLPGIADSPNRLWTSGYHSSLGINDKMPEAVAHKLGNSLNLIHLDELEVQVVTQKAATGGSYRKVRGEFEYRATTYNLKITDPEADAQFRKEDDGNYVVEDCYLTISLGEPFNGECYKLIAGVLTV